MSRCAAPFVMVSSLVLNVGAGEFSEGNAVAWGAFASDNAAVSVSDDARRVRVGAQSVRLVTASGFMIPLWKTRAANECMPRITWAIRCN